MISVFQWCAAHNVDYTALVNLLRKYNVDYSKLGKDYLVQDESALKDVLNRHLVDSLSERKRKRENARARAQLNKEASKLRTKLLQEGFTPDQITDMIAETSKLTIIDRIQTLKATTEAASDSSQSGEDKP